MLNPWSTALTVAVLAAISITLLIWRRRAIVGTTLLAPWLWAVGSLLTLAASEMLLASASVETAPRWAAHVRFLAAATTFCPTMAQLGAKRPQDRAWQFIVASLWIVAALPAWQSLVYAPGRTLDLETTWRWFVFLLIVLGAANGLPTRFWPSWLLLAAAQGCLFAAQLPIAIDSHSATTAVAALALIALAILLACLGLPGSAPSTSEFDRQWRDFRDSFGTLWSLRIAERFNAAATMYDWPVRLHWHGLVDQATGQDPPPDDESPGEQASSMRQVWHSLVLRFVSPAWLSARENREAVGTVSESSEVH